MGGGILVITISSAFLPEDRSTKCLAPKRAFCPKYHNAQMKSVQWAMSKRIMRLTRGGYGKTVKSYKLYRSILYESEMQFYIVMYRCNFMCPSWNYVMLRKSSKFIQNHIISNLTIQVSSILYFNTITRKCHLYVKEKYQ